MNLEILKSLAKVISDQDKLLKAYKDATNENITMSELLSALVPKGKKNLVLLTIYWKFFRGLGV